MPVPSNTLATYRLECRRLLHDATGKFWSNAELNDYINDARARVCSDTGCLRRLVTCTLSQNLEQYPIGGVTGGNVVSAGAGYSGMAVTVTGDGVGATATAVLTPNAGTIVGILASVSITSPGIGYTSIPDLVVSGPGTGADAAPSMGAQTFAIGAAGAGYAVSDLVTLSGGARATPVQFVVTSIGGGGTIAALNLVNPGSYTVLPSAPAALTGGHGSGGTISVTGWGIVSALVTAPGSGYVSAPGVVAIGGGASSPALFSTTISVSGGKSLASIIVTNAGTGYTTAGFTLIGDGSGAVATPTILPADTLDIMNISPIWGNQRPPLNYMPWTELNAKVRVYVVQPSLPRVWSRYGTSGGIAFVQPPPDQAYVTEFDTAILPDPLATDVQVDQMQYPYTTPVAFYACWKAKLKQQQIGEAEAFLLDYKRKILEAQASVQMRRIPNPYAGYSGG